MYCVCLRRWVTNTSWITSRVSYNRQKMLYFENTCVHPRILVGYVLLMFSVFCMCLSSPCVLCINLFCKVNSWFPLRFSLTSIYKTANCLLKLSSKIKCTIIKIFAYSVCVRKIWWSMHPNLPLYQQIMWPHRWCMFSWRMPTWIYRCYLQYRYV